MSRIDEALRRITGTAPEPRPASSLGRFTAEKSAKHDQAKFSQVPATGPGPQGEAKTWASQRASAQATPLRWTTPAATTAPVMVLEQAAPSSEPDAPDDEKSVDAGQILDYARFLGGALRRHKMLAAGTLCAALGMTAAVAVLWPRTYHVQVRLLAQRNAVMTALSNPGRAVPWDADAPTRAAAETVLRRDNLVSLIEQTHLVEEWTRRRAPILKLKDALIALVSRHAPTNEERLDQLVNLLGNRMVVLGGPVGDGTVSIDLTWPDAQMAFGLVSAAQQAFLDARQKAETAAIGESIGILERYSETLHGDISRTLEELQRTQAQRRSSAATAQVATSRRAANRRLTAILPPVPSAALGAPAVSVDLDDPAIPRLKETLTAMRQDITNLEDQRQRQLSELQTRLAQLTTLYTATHPSVVAAQQSLAALTHESPQLAAMKAEAQKLEAEYQQRVAAAMELQQAEQIQAGSAKGVADSSEQQSAAERPVAPPPPAPASPSTGDSADFASLRLRLELNQLESVLERTNGARIELAVSQAAFKYRYSVITPAQLPKAPIRPSLPLVVGGGIFVSLLLVFAAVVAKDLLSDRIFERWQIERQLGLSILGVVENG